MAAKALPCPTLLRLLLDYNPETGKLYWKHRGRIFFQSRRQFTVWHIRYAGAEAFTAKNSDGYKGGAVLGRSLKAHRVVWAITFGNWPEAEVDHINGNRSDNRIVNLRVVSSLENAKNAVIPINNTSGHVGVSWAKTRAKWASYIRLNGTLVMLGYFEDRDDAIAARRMAEIAHGFSPIHGLTQIEREAYADDRIGRTEWTRC